MPRAAKIAIWSVAGVLALLVLIVLIATQTQFGRDKIRGFALEQLQNSAHGIVTMGAFRGNLLRGIVIEHLAIEDSTGAPFFRADTVQIGYSLSALIRQRIDLDDIRLVRPQVVLDQPPGLAWNFARIFPSDTTQTAARQGFGAWIVLSDVSVVDGSVEVRTEWAPDDSLSADAQQEAIATALSEESRQHVEAVANGYQGVQRYQAINGRIDRLRLANPDSAAIVVDVGELALEALPFRPPAAEIRALSGRVISAGDTLIAENVQIALPESQLALNGTYLLSGGADISAAARPVDFADLRWLYPPLPEGTATLEARVLMQGERTRVVAPVIDLAMEWAVVQGNVDATFGDSIRLGPSNLQFAGVDTDLIRRFAPDLEVPRDGVLAGQVALAGSPDALAVDGNVSFTERNGSVSHLIADGSLGSDAAGFRAEDLRVRAAPIQLSLLSSVADIPVGGVITGSAILNGSSADDFLFDVDLVHASGGTGRSRLLADGGVTLGDDEPRINGVQLRFDPVQMALARAFSPELPVDGTLTGSAAVNGTPANLQLTADLTHSSPTAGVSRLTAAGGVGFGEVVSMRDLRLGFSPLQVGLAHLVDPELPVDGVLAGNATLTGTTASSVMVTLDMTHTGTTGDSRLVGTAQAPMGEGRQLAADLQLLPLSLETVGRFAPAAGLHGSAAGTVQATGTLRELALSFGLEAADGGRIDLAGNFDLESDQKTYDLAAAFTAFDPAAITTRAPTTALTGNANLVGMGTDPTTMTAALAADITGVAIDSVDVDSIQIRAQVDGGLAMVEQGTIRLASASADVEGSFGLTEGRSGTLRYALRVDTLADFAELMPPDSGAVSPRPSEVAEAIAVARADSARLAQATEVERAATGFPAEPTLEAPSIPPLPRDSLAGSVEASGLLAGNIGRFDVDGTASFRELVALGNTVGTGAAGYAWQNAPGTDSELTIDANLSEARLAGFRLDSIGAHVDYSGAEGGGTGTVDLAIRQDADREYRAVADFLFSPDRSEVNYSDLTLRFDTVYWRSSQPGTIGWAGDGVDITGVELRSDQGGLIAAEGRLPSEGDADLRVTIERLQVGDVLGLLQDTIPLRGIFTGQAEMQGTAAAPLLAGTVTMREVVMDTIDIPDIEATFNYEAEELRAEGELTDSGRMLLGAVASVPLNLAVSSVTEPRFPEDAPIQLDIRADSLPLEALPSFTDAVADVRGRIRGDIFVRGTRSSPDVTGAVDLDLGSLNIVQQGLELREIGGALRLAGTELVLDSLNALSGGGTISITGGAELPSLTEPILDFTMTARDARVLDNDMGTLSADADIEISGPLDGTVVTGRVQIRDGVINAPELGEPQRAEIDAPAVAALGDTAAIQLASSNEMLDNLRLDVQLGIARDTWIRNSAANIEVFTPEETGDIDIRMEGGFETLSLNGTVNVDRGEYTVAGRRIRISQGAVVFLGETPINPILQLTAEQQVRLSGRPAFAIQLLIGGTMQAPRITVESNAQPPIAESDLLSYFAFGESTSSLIQSESGGAVGGGSSGGGALLGPIGALATQQLGATAVGVVVDELEQGARQTLGLDVLNITPAPLPAELAIQGYLNVFRGAQFEAGAYLGDRWFIAGQGRTSLVLPGMRLEYRTPSGFEWVTSWEPRYRVPIPSLTIEESVETENVLGVFMQWRRRF